MSHEARQKHEYAHTEVNKLVTQFCLIVKIFFPLSCFIQQSLYSLTSTVMMHQNLNANLEKKGRSENSQTSFWQEQGALIPEPSNVARDSKRNQPIRENRMSPVLTDGRGEDGHIGGCLLPLQTLGTAVKQNLG